MSNSIRAAPLIGTLRQTICLTGHLHLPEGYTFYAGDYAVTPTVSSQTLPTKDQVMHEDIQIQPIPYWETSNDHNGTTIIIGRDIT